jgi:cytochrome P450
LGQKRGRMLDLDPIAAVTAADPYPFYARLVAERPFYREGRLGMWVASSSAAVEAVLSHSDLRVRPEAEPVPAALIGTRLGETFSQFVRMTDGAGHAPRKRAVANALGTVTIGEVTAASERSAASLIASFGTQGLPPISAFVFGMPALTLATLLKFSPPAAEVAAVWTGALVRAMSPGGTEQERAEGLAALAKLNETVATNIRADAAPGSLLNTLRDDGHARGLDDSALIANAIGFLFQTYDATAALIGNSLVALAAGLEYERPQPDDASTSVAPRSLRSFVEEVTRYDSPVQNTRRFAAANATVLGHEVRAGEAILVILAAANRDPAANPSPERFSTDRAERRTFTFGLGAHACPGASLATTMACVAVSRILESGIDLAGYARPGYRPSGNVRIPDFG